MIETQPTRGTATFDDQTNRLTYTITDPTFFEGVDTFTYSSTDKDGETDTGVVTVNIVNLAPKVADTAIFLNQGTTASAPIQLGIIAGNGPMTQHTADRDRRCARHLHLERSRNLDHFTQLHTE